MPLYLSQFSRREFLKRAALAGSALALMPQSQAGIFGKSRDKHTFAFFSDAHIAADVTIKHSDVNMADNLAACVRELSAWPVKPAAIVVNGDLSYLTGMTGDYAAFGNLIELARAFAPVHLSLGNHDERENFWAALPQDATPLKSVPEKQLGFFPSEYANWFLLDSLDVPNTAPGEIGTAQLDWLACELDLRPEKPAIVVGHHNPQFQQITTGLKDTMALMEILVPRRQVKAFIFGHTHNWHVEQHASGIHLINLPPTAFVFKAGRPSGWVRATLAPDGADFELRCLDSKHPEHAQVKQFKWRSA